MTLNIEPSAPPTSEPVTGESDSLSWPKTERLAYAAALIDGEGCISVDKSGRESLWTYAVRVDVGMTVKAKAPIIETLCDEFGGRVRMTKAATDRWAEQWGWYIGGNDAARFLEAIAPWLVLKREQALVAVVFQGLVDELREHNGGKRKKWPQSLRAAGERAYQRIKELNATGPSALEISQRGNVFGFIVNGKIEASQTTLFGGPSEVKLPKSGMVRDGVLYELPMSELVTDESVSSLLLRTPQAQLTEAKGDIKLEGRTPADPQVGLADQVVELLGTPRTGKNVSATDVELGRTKGRLEIQIALLPTPAAQESGQSPEYHAEMKQTKMGGTPRSTVTSLSVMMRQLDETGVLTNDLLPTPVVDQGRNKTSGRKEDSQHHEGTMLTDVAWEGSWGKYESGIRRHEDVLGRDAPAPSDGKRLNPEFVEFMMMLPAGWVTDPALGLSRTGQLKALGNAIVPNQAAAAWGSLLGLQVDLERPSDGHLVPTPAARDYKGGTMPESEDQLRKPRGADGASDLCSVAMWIGRDQDDLIPTPTAWLGRRPVQSEGDPERWKNKERSNELSDFIAWLGEEEQ